MTTTTVEFYRLDPLTGCHNFLSFVETLDHLSSTGEKRQFSILHTDMDYLQVLNKTKGHAYGDSAIRWLGIVLQEECKCIIYRTGGDEFAAILTAKLQSEYEELLHCILDRLNREGQQLGIPVPATRITLVHYDTADNISLNNVLFQLGEAMMCAKRDRNRTINIFFARDLIKAGIPVDGIQPVDKRSQDILRWIANDSIGRLRYIGRMLEEAQKTSFIDSISGLPNMRAAFFKIEQAFKNANSSNQPFSLLLMDSDNLRAYNSVSYAVGDGMIQKMSAVLSNKLRPGDFVARWRTGDEFIVILPDTNDDGAVVVAERFCTAVREASQEWQFPTSISIGIASYPTHGADINTLVDKAESALKSAKNQGKDRAILAD